MPFAPLRCSARSCLWDSLPWVLYLITEKRLCWVEIRWLTWPLNNIPCLIWEALGSFLQCASGHPFVQGHAVWSFLQHFGDSEQNASPCALYNSSCYFYQQPHHQWQGNTGSHTCHSVTSPCFKDKMVCFRSWAASHPSCFRCFPIKSNPVFQFLNVISTLNFVSPKNICIFF